MRGCSGRRRSKASSNAPTRRSASKRVANDHFYVATGPSGIVAFADALERADRLELLAIYALPEFRRQGAGTALLRKLLDLFPVLDISADVLEGNRKGEVFYERRGFSPRETIQLTILDEPVVERRWWRAADSMRSPQ